MPRIHGSRRANAAWLMPNAKAAATAVAVISHPVRDTLMGGHWTLMFLALIVADVFLPTVRWPRGLLSGIVVALGGGWPLLSAVAAFSALKNYRAIGIVLGSCAASFGLGFVVARETTLSYLHTLWHWPETILAALTGSINNTAYAMVARALGGSSTLSWLIMVVVVLAVAHFAAQRAGDRYVAAAFGLCLPALVLPYSTATVWVLLLPLVVLLARWNPIAAAFGAYLLGSSGSQGDWTTFMVASGVNGGYHRLRCLPVPRRFTCWC